MRLIDSIAYSTSKSSEFPITVAKALNLAEKSLLYIDSSTGSNISHEVSFARQNCCDISDLSSFAYANPTPSKTNNGSYLPELGAPNSLLVPHKQALMGVRINEAGLTVGREHILEQFNGPPGGDVTVDFVEVIGTPGLKLDGMVAVIYSGEESENKFKYATSGLEGPYFSQSAFIKQA